MYGSCETCLFLDKKRYKIEGKVNDEKFNMIIQFIDNTYKEYDLISLQVGNKKY